MLKEYDTCKDVVGLHMNKNYGNATKTKQTQFPSLPWNINEFPSLGIGAVVLFVALGRRTWPDPTPVARKLYGGLEDRLRTATFIAKTGVSI